MNKTIQGNIGLFLKRRDITLLVSQDILSRCRVELISKCFIYMQKWYLVLVGGVEHVAPLAD